MTTKHVAILSLNLLCAGLSLAGTELVTNGGFESGDLNAWAATTDQNLGVEKPSVGYYQTKESGESSWTGDWTHYQIWTPEEDIEFKFIEQYVTEIPQPSASYRLSLRVGQRDRFDTPQIYGIELRIREKKEGSELTRPVAAIVNNMPGIELPEPGGWVRWEMEFSTSGELPPGQFYIRVLSMDEPGDKRNGLNYIGFDDVLLEKIN